MDTQVAPRRTEMRYLLKFYTPTYAGEDEYEGSSRAGIDSYETSEVFDAENEGDALAKSIEILRKRTLTFRGKEYRASAIALYQVIDISAFSSARRT